MLVARALAKRRDVPESDGKLGESEKLERCGHGCGFCYGERRKNCVRILKNKKFKITNYSKL